MRDADWPDLTRRNARSVQTTIGWIYWDPGAITRYEALGVPGPLGYIAARGAPLASAGADALIAAFGSISPFVIRLTFELARDDLALFDRCWEARNDAIVEGLHAYAPAIVNPLRELGPHLWPVIEQLPSVGRVLFGAHLRMPRSNDPLLDGWHAVNCLREWRGDTHWALITAAGLTGVEASIIHNAWLGYERDWLAHSRGSAPDEIEAAWTSLTVKGLVVAGDVTPAGVALRQRIEDDTDRLTVLPWQLLGYERALAFQRDFEPPCVDLLRRVDETAGPNYQPGSRIR